MTNDQTGRRRLPIGSFNFGHWSLIGHWCLVIGHCLLGVWALVIASTYDLRMPSRASTLLLATLFSIVGCATSPPNHSFNLSALDARRALREMRESPRGLERPVVVLDGLGPPSASWLLAGELKRETGDDRVVGATFVFDGSFEDCRRRLVDALEKRFPSSDPAETSEVDVVAVSMGGLVARYAAAPPPTSAGKRLRIARLFTISSPHRGAAMAELPAAFGRKQLDMRSGSRFLHDLAEREVRGRPYELVPYARLGDLVVGEAN